MGTDFLFVEMLRYPLQKTLIYITLPITLWCSKGRVKWQYTKNGHCGSVNKQQGDLMCSGEQKAAARTLGTSRI